MAIIVLLNVTYSVHVYVSSCDFNLPFILHVKYSVCCGEMCGHPLAGWSPNKFIGTMHRQDHKRL